MRLNLQFKLAAVLLGLVLPIVIAMGFLAWLSTRNTIESLVRDQIVSVNASKESHLRQSMTSMRTYVDTLGHDPTILDALQKFAAASEGLSDAEDTPKLWDYFRENYPAEEDAAVPEPAETPSARRLQELYVVQNAFPLLQHDQMKAPQGDDSPYTRVHRQYHDVMTKFRDVNRIHNLLLVDGASRRIVYAVLKEADFQASVDGKTLEGTNLKIAIDQALAGRTVFADYQRFAPAFNVPVAYFVAPVYDRDQEHVVGAVVAQVETEFLTRVLAEENPAQEGRGTTSDTFVIGQDGYFRSEPRALTENINGLIRELRAEGRPEPMLRRIRKEKSAILALSLTRDGRERMIKRGSGFNNAAGYDGQPVFAAFKPVDFNGVRWFLDTRREQSEALKPLNDLRRAILLASLGVMVLAAFVSLFLARALLRPIQGLGEAARRFGKGERNIRIEETSREDEFGELARQFDAMIIERGRVENVQSQIRRNIVHDLKTPVTVIKGMGETLMIPEMAEDASWRDEMVLAIVEQSDRLLDDLRDILLPIDSHYSPDYEDFDLAQLVYRAAQSERQTARARDHLLHLHGLDEPFLVRADRRKMRRVVENLISNAIKYSPGNGKEVWIELRREGEMAEIAVRDEGLGMTPDQLVQVLEDGGRVDEHANLGIEGTGFGLDSVQKVLRAHGGELRATSTPNKGSTFTAAFPIGLDPALMERDRAGMLR